MRFPFVTFETHTKFPRLPVGTFLAQNKVHQISYRKLFTKLFIPNYIVSKIINRSNNIFNSGMIFFKYSLSMRLVGVFFIMYKYELYCKCVENMNEIAARL